MAAKKTSNKPATKPAPTAPFVQTDFLKGGFWATHWPATAIFAALAFILYGSTLGFGYLQDDQLFIWDNEFVQKGFAGLAQIFGHDSLLGYYKDPATMLEGGRYRPLPLATFAAEIGIFGKDCTGAAHFNNVLLYALAGALLYRVLLGLFPLKDGQSWLWSLPFWATAIFMLHPLHVEVVANIKSRDEILAFLGSFAALWALMRYFDTQENRWRWVASAFFLLGLLSKENTVTFLAVIPLALWFFSKIPLGRILSACLPLVFALLLFLLMRALALEKPIPHADELVLNPFMGMSIGERFATIFLSLGWSLKLLFSPYPLTIDYYPNHVPKVNWADWRALASLLVLAAMAWWAMRQVRSQRMGNGTTWAVPAFAVLYFVSTISIVSNILVKTSTFMNERYLFLPSVAFCLLVAWLSFVRIPEKMAASPLIGKWAGMGLIAALAVGFAAGTLVRVPDWGGDGTRLTESAVRVSKESYRANYYYANMLYNDRLLPMSKNAGSTSTEAMKSVMDTIERHLDKSLAVNPGYRLAAPLKVQLAVRRFNDDKDLDKLLKNFETLIMNQPGNGDMLVPVLDVLKSLKGADPNIYNFFCYRVGYNFYFRKMQDPAGGIEFLNLALENFPQDTNTMQALIEVYQASGNTAKVRELQQRLGLGR